MKVISKKVIQELDCYVKEKIIKKVKEKLGKKVVFDCRLVGSGAKNLVVADKKTPLT